MSTEQILSSDGIPLEISLKKAERKNKLRAMFLVGPLLLFLLITYIIPIGDMLFRSVDDRMITKMLPNTFSALEKWDGKDLPDENVYEAIYNDFYPLAIAKESGKLYQRLNYEKSGFSSGLKKTNRNIKKFEKSNFKEQFMATHKIWNNVEYWIALKNTAPNWSYVKYLKGVDLKLDEERNVVQVAEDRKIYKTLWRRTLKVAFWVTIFCFILSYPIAHLLATLPMKYSNLLMILCIAAFLDIITCKNV